MTDRKKIAYRMGQETAGKSYDEIVYGDLVPSWVFDSHGYNVFFEAGRRGAQYPQYITGWRYGNIPECGQSHNYRDNIAEAGVSLMQVDGYDKIKTLSELGGINDRPVIRVGGYLHPFEVGGDGEPLIVFAKEI
jgi:hypothetical protein